MVRARVRRPRPPTRANVSSEIISPACRATTVAPTMRSLPARTWTLTKPSVSPARNARSTRAIRSVQVRTAVPSGLAPGSAGAQGRANAVAAKHQIDAVAPHLLLHDAGGVEVLARHDLRAVAQQ